MKVDYSASSKATARLALATYEAALERHRKDGERLNVGTMGIQTIQGRVEILKRMFSNVSKAETIEYTAPLRVTMCDVFACEIREVKKLREKVAGHLVDVNDVERQVTHLFKLLHQLNDQYAMEMDESSPAIDKKPARGKKKGDRQLTIAPKREPPTDRRIQ